jgi:hypothetical protein
LRADLRIVDSQRAHAHTKAKVLAVSKTGLDNPAFGIKLDDLRRRELAVAGGQMPGLLHARRLHADDRPDLLAGGGDFGVAQFPRPSALADPIGGQARFAIGRADMDIAAKADDILKAKAIQELEQFDVAKTAIGETRAELGQGSSPSRPQIKIAECVSRRREEPLSAHRFGDSANRGRSEPGPMSAAGLRPKDWTPTG